jgi:hypothetical protein
VQPRSTRNEQGAVFVTERAHLYAQKQQRHEVVAMINASQIKEHMEVKGSDGKHVGTVLGVESGQEDCRRDCADLALATCEADSSVAVGASSEAH